MYQTGYLSLFAVLDTIHSSRKAEVGPVAMMHLTEAS